MIITKKVKINIQSRNINYYRKKGYVCNFGETITVSIDDLPLSNHSEIECICQNCKETKIIGYHNYNKNIKNGGIYYCKNCKIIKIENSNLKKYGVKTTLLDKTTKEKIRITMLEKYGVETAPKSKELMIKSAETFKKTYEKNKDEIIKKRIKNSLIKNGCEFPQSLDKTKKKVKLTFLEKYGVENVFQNEDVKNKIKETNLEKYGVENYTQTNEYKNHIKSLNLNYDIRLEKMKETSLLRYGYEYPAQNIDIFNKTQKAQLKIKYFKNIKYQGTYELDFLIFCDKNNILNEITRNITLKYFYNDKNKIYYPDFFIKKLNLIIEIKSDYYYKLYLEKNLCKQKSCLEQNYDFIFIINKNYDNFLEKIKAII